MSNAMSKRMNAAKSGAGAAVKAKSTAAPLVEPAADLRVVPEATVTDLDTAREVTALATAVDVLADEDAPLVMPKLNRAADEHDEDAPASTDKPTAADEPAVTPTVRRRKKLVGEELIAALTAKRAAMGTAVESRVLGIPMSEAGHQELQLLDRDLAATVKRPINRTRLLTLAVEMVLADPSKYASRYLEQYDAGVTWERRLQARIPVELDDQLPTLRYTGESRQSAGMLVSIAVSDLLTSTRAAVTDQS